MKALARCKELLFLVLFLNNKMNKLIILVLLALILSCNSEPTLNSEEQEEFDDAMLRDSLRLDSMKKANNL